MKQLRMCAKRTTPETPGVPRRRRSYLEGLQHRGNCRAAARHLYASCPRCRHGSPPKKGFFWVFEHVRKPWSQGPRLVPGSSQARPRVVPGSQYFREWRAPDTMRTLGDLPDAAAAAAPRPGAVPGILAPSQAFWYRPRHSGTLVFALWQCAGQAGRLAAIPSNLAVSSTVSWSILATCRFVSHVGGHAARGRCTRHSGTLSRALWRRPRLPGGFLAASRARPRAVLGGTEV